MKRTVCRKSSASEPSSQPASAGAGAGAHLNIEDNAIALSVVADDGMERVAGRHPLDETQSGREWHYKVPACRTLRAEDTEISVVEFVAEFTAGVNE